MMTDDIDAMAERMERTLRAAMEPRFAEGGRTAVFARLTLALAPAWAKALAVEVQRADASPAGFAGGRAADIAEANVVANLMGSTCGTLLQGDPEMTERWICLVEACFREARKSPEIMEFAIPRAGHA
jgi:hypothetical protein